MMSNQNGKRMKIIASLAVIAIIFASSTLYLVLNTSFGSHSPFAQNPSTPLGQGNRSPSGNLALGQAASAYTPIDTNVTRTITVSGTGLISFVPSEALVALSVVTTNSTAGEATSANAAITINVIRALNSIGVANSSIQTTGYTLYPNYNNYNNYQVPQILGYTITNSLQVNLTGTSPEQLGVKAGQAIHTAVKAGANQVNLAFTAPNQRLALLNNEALQQAVISASSQAQTIAKALGVTITGVLAVSNGNGYYQPQQNGALFAAAVETVTVTAGGTPIVPGTLTATASVQVTYSIGW